MNTLAILAMMPLIFIGWIRVLSDGSGHRNDIIATLVLSFVYTIFTVLFIWGIANL